jgi:hypothetical protein
MTEVLDARDFTIGDTMGPHNPVIVCVGYDGENDKSIKYVDTEMTIGSNLTSMDLFLGGLGKLGLTITGTDTTASAPNVYVRAKTHMTPAVPADSYHATYDPTATSYDYSISITSLTLNVGNVFNLIVSNYEGNDFRSSTSETKYVIGSKIIINNEPGILRLRNIGGELRPIDADGSLTTVISENFPARAAGPKDDFLEEQSETLGTGFNVTSKYTPYGADSLVAETSKNALSTFLIRISTTIISSDGNSSGNTFASSTTMNSIVSSTGSTKISSGTGTNLVDDFNAAVNYLKNNLISDETTKSFLETAAASDQFSAFGRKLGLFYQVCINLGILLGNAGSTVSVATSTLGMYNGNLSGNDSADAVSETVSGTLVVKNSITYWPRIGTLTSGGRYLLKTEENTFMPPILASGDGGSNLTIVPGIKDGKFIIGTRDFSARPSVSTNLEAHEFLQDATWANSSSTNDINVYTIDLTKYPDVKTITKCVLEYKKSDITEKYEFTVTPTKNNYFIAMYAGDGMNIFQEFFSMDGTNLNGGFAGLYTGLQMKKGNRNWLNNTNATISNPYGISETASIQVFNVDKRDVNKQISVLEVAPHITFSLVDTTATSSRGDYKISFDDTELFNIKNTFQEWLLPIMVVKLGTTYYRIKRTNTGDPEAVSPATILSLNVITPPEIIVGKKYNVGAQPTSEDYYGMYDHPYAISIVSNKDTEIKFGNGGIPMWKNLVYPIILEKSFSFKFASLMTAVESTAGILKVKINNLGACVIGGRIKGPNSSADTISTHALGVVFFNTDQSVFVTTPGSSNEDTCINASSTGMINATDSPDLLVYGTSDKFIKLTTAEVRIYGGGSAGTPGTPGDALGILGTRTYGGFISSSTAPCTTSVFTGALSSGRFFKQRFLPLRTSDLTDNDLVAYVNKVADDEAIKLPHRHNVGDLLFVQLQNTSMEAVTVNYNATSTSKTSKLLAAGNCESFKYRIIYDNTDNIDAHRYVIDDRPTSSILSDCSIATSNNGPDIAWEPGKNITSLISQIAWAAGLGSFGAGHANGGLYMRTTPTAVFVAKATVSKNVVSGMSLFNASSTDVLTVEFQLTSSVSTSIATATNRAKILVTNDNAARGSSTSTNRGLPYVANGVKFIVPFRVYDASKAYTISIDRLTGISVGTGTAYDISSGTVSITKNSLVAGMMNYLLFEFQNSGTTPKYMGSSVDVTTLLSAVKNKFGYMNESLPQYVRLIVSGGSSSPGFGISLTSPVATDSYMYFSLLPNFGRYLPIAKAPTNIVSNPFGSDYEYVFPAWMSMDFDNKNSIAAEAFMMLKSPANIFYKKGSGTTATLHYKYGKDDKDLTTLGVGGIKYSSSSESALCGFDITKFLTSTSEISNMSVSDAPCAIAAYKVAMKYAAEGYRTILVSPFFPGDEVRELGIHCFLANAVGLQAALIEARNVSNKTSPVLIYHSGTIDEGNIGKEPILQLMPLFTVSSDIVEKKILGNIAMTTVFDEVKPFNTSSKLDIELLSLDKKVLGITGGDKLYGDPIGSSGETHNVTVSMKKEFLTSVSISDYLSNIGLTGAKFNDGTDMVVLNDTYTKNKMFGGRAIDPVNDGMNFVLTTGIFSGLTTTSKILTEARPDGISGTGYFYKYLFEVSSSATLSPTNYSFCFDAKKSTKVASQNFSDLVSKGFFTSYVMKSATVYTASERQLTDAENKLKRDKWSVVALSADLTSSTGPVHTDTKSIASALLVAEYRPNTTFVQAFACPSAFAAPIPGAPVPAYIYTVSSYTLLKLAESRLGGVIKKINDAEVYIDVTFDTSKTRSIKPPAPVADNVVKSETPAPKPKRNRRR